MGRMELTECVSACKRPVPIQVRQKCQHGREEVGTHSQPLTKKLFVDDSCWEKGNQFSSMAKQWIYEPHSGADLMLR